MSGRAEQTQKREDRLPQRARRNTEVRDQKPEVRLKAFPVPPRLCENPPPISVKLVVISG